MERMSTTPNAATQRGRRPDLLSPRELAALGGLEFVSREVVEGFLAGLHRSPHRGFSVEFAEHRMYQPGDDLRYVDWRMFGRSDFSGLAFEELLKKLVPPATLVALMGFGAAEIFVPMLLVGFIATAIAIIAAKLLGRLPMYRRTNPDLALTRARGAAEVAS